MRWLALPFVMLVSGCISQEAASVPADASAPGEGGATRPDGGALSPDGGTSLACAYPISSACCNPDRACSGEWSQGSTCEAWGHAGAQVWPTCEGYNAVGIETDVTTLDVYDPSGHLLAFIAGGGSEADGGTGGFFCNAGPSNLFIPPECLAKWASNAGVSSCLDAGPLPDGAPFTIVDYCAADGG